MPKAKAKLSALALSLVEAYKIKRAWTALKPPSKKIAGVGAESGSHAYGSGRKAVLVEVPERAKQRQGRFQPTTESEKPPG